MLFWLLLIPLVASLSDFYTLRSERTLQTCAYIEDSNRWLFNQHLRSQISVRFPLQDLDRNAYKVDLLSISADDLANIKLDHLPTYKVCDETSNNKGWCDYEDLDKTDDPSLDDYLANDLNSAPISHEVVDPWDLTPHVIPLNTSGIYCLLLRATGLSNLQTMTVVVDWQQSSGQLILKDYSYLWLSWYFCVAYTCFAALYAILIRRRMTPNTKRSMLRRLIRDPTYQLQCKVLLYSVAMASSFFATVWRYSYTNSYGYESLNVISFWAGFIILVLDSLLVAWVAYNLMILMMGLRHRPVAAILATAVFLELLAYGTYNSVSYSVLGSVGLFGTIISTQYVVGTLIFVICGFVTSHKSASAISRRLIATILLILAILGIQFFFRTTKDSVYASGWIYGLEYTAIVIGGLIWSNVVVDGSRMVLRDDHVLP